MPEKCLLLAGDQGLSKHGGKINRRGRTTVEQIVQGRLYLQQQGPEVVRSKTRSGRPPRITGIESNPLIIITATFLIRHSDGCPRFAHMICVKGQNTILVDN